MCKEKELTEAAYRYYVDEACIEDIAKQLHRSYNYTRLIIKKYRGAFRDAIIMHWLEQEKKLQAVADEYFNGTMTTEQIKETFHVSGDTVRKVAQKQKPPFVEKPEFTPEELEMEKMFRFESEETENLFGIRKKKKRKPIYGIYNRTSGRWIQGCLQGKIQTILFTSIKACKQERTERNLNPEEFKAALYGWRME